MKTRRGSLLRISPLSALGFQGRPAASRRRVNDRIAGCNDRIGKVEAEIGNLRGEVKAEIGNLRGEVKAEIAGVRTEIANFKSSLYWTAWILGVSIVTVIFTLTKLFP